MSNPLRILSLFSGIGGFELAAEQINLACQEQIFLVAQMCEKDLFCQQVLKKNFPGVPIHGDITTFTASPGEFDVITAGFPCQDASECNPHGRGLEGERTGLFYEVVRIACDVRPRFILLENVPALLSRGFGNVLSSLARSGFDAEWQCIRASEMGAPHTRKRLFLIAYSQSAGAARPCSPQTRPNFAPFSSHSFWGQNPPPERTICSLDDGVPRPLVRQRLKAIGNSVCPQAVAVAYQRIMEINKCITN
jgi:DNA (cytosine-5)-methyltransferase 1